MESIKSLKNSKFDKNYSMTFNKNIEYLINKYEKNIFYSYKFLVLKEKNETKFLIVFKEIYLKTKVVIRFIDFFGNFKFLPKIKDSIMSFLKTKI